MAVVRRKIYSMSFDSAVMDEFKEFSKKVGLPVSRYLEILMKSSMSMNQPVQSMIKDFMEVILDNDKSMTDLEKEKARALIRDDDLGLKDASAAARAKPSAAERRPSDRTPRAKLASNKT